MFKSDELNVKSLRILSAEAIEKAKSGHPGLPLGAAPMAYALWSRQMKHNPANSKWVDRDRFVLSAGHGSMLLYALLHVFGYDLTMEDIKEFRQLGSRTPGHPEYAYTDGVETTTGPLGQGMANAVGMAMAEAMLAARFNKEDLKIVDHYTYALVGDGCLMEGITSEASSLAGTLGLDKLILLYDSNNISIEGSTDLAFREDVGKRYEAYDWQVLTVEDGNDLDKISEAIGQAKEEKTKPSLIIIKTVIGEGSPKKQGTAAAHGAPLGEEELALTKEYYDWDYPAFTLPEETKEFKEEFAQKAQELEEEWQKTFAQYEEKYPALAKEFLAYLAGNPEGLEKLAGDEDYWNINKDLASRQASGLCIEKIASYLPEIVGGSADLAPSNMTYIEGKEDFSKENRQGSNIRFGVREHAMAAIANGIALHGGLRIFVGTFFTFTDYMKSSMRLSALMGLSVTYILTHDSIGVGEDGPTHQPIEHLAALRSMPGMTDFRPADARETAAGWYYALTNEKGPVSLVLSRQTLPMLENTGKEALKGAYVLAGSLEEKPDLIIMATGSEVSLALESAKELEAEGKKVRLVSMPSFKLFEDQDEDYKEKLLPLDVEKRVVIEAASSFGWHKYSGLKGKIFSIDSFGESANANDLFKHFGFEKEKITQEIKKYLAE